MWTIGLSLAIGYGLGLAIVEVFDLFEEDEAPAATDPSLNTENPNLDLLDSVEDGPSEDQEPVETPIEDDVAVDTPPDEGGVIVGSDDADVIGPAPTGPNVIEGSDGNDVIGPAQKVAGSGPTDNLFAGPTAPQPEELDVETIANGEFDPETDILVIDPIATLHSTPTAQLVEDTANHATQLVIAVDGETQAEMTINAIGLSWQNIDFSAWAMPPTLI